MMSFSLSGGVEVYGFISPTDPLDTYPVIDPLYGIDGFRNVNLISDLNNIPLPRRRAGMVVGISGGTQYYKLNPSPWNFTISDWDDFTPYDPSLDVYVTGSTLSSATQNSNIQTSILSYHSLPIGGPHFIITENTFTTGGTYDNNTALITFKRNDGNTGYTIDLSSLDLNDTYVTGGTLTLPTNATNLGTINLNYNQDIPPSTYGLPYTDTFITGFTYNNNTFTLYDNSGNTFIEIINVVTGLTVNGNLFISGDTNQIGDINLTGNTNQVGDINLTGNTNQIGDINLTGNTNQVGDINLTGNTNQIGDVNLTGNTNQIGDINLTGNTNQVGDINLTGNTNQVGDVNLTGNTNQIGDINLTGNTNQIGDVNLTGNTNQIGDVNLTGNTNQIGDINLTGNTNQIGDVNLTGNTNQVGDINLTGNTNQIGDINLTGNTNQVGDINLTGNTNQIGDINLTGNTNQVGDINLTGNTNQVGDVNLTGNTNQIGDVNLTGNTNQIGDVNLTGNTNQIGDVNLTGNTNQIGDINLTGNTNQIGDVNLTGNTNQVGDINLTGNTNQIGDINLTGNTNQVGDINLTGNTNQIGDINLTGNTNQVGDINLTGNTNQVGDVNLTGNTNQIGDVNLTGNTNQIGDINLTGNTNQIGDVNLTGNTNQIGDVNITGNTYISGSSLPGECALYVDGNVCIDGDVNITGDTFMSGDFCMNNMNSGGLPTGTNCFDTTLIPTGTTVIHQFQGESGVLAHIGDLATGEPNSRGYTYFENNLTNTTFTAVGVGVYTPVIGAPTTFAPYNNLFIVTTGLTTATINKLTYNYPPASGVTTATYLKFTVSLTVQNAQNQQLTFQVRRKRGVTFTFLPIGMSITPQANNIQGITFNGISDAWINDEFQVVVKNDTGAGPTNSIRIVDLSFSMFT